MTAGERLFIELQLKSIWRKLAVQRKKKATSGKRSPAQETTLPFIKEIEVLGNEYIRDIIFSGMGAYILMAEKERLFDEIEAAVNSPEMKEKFMAALYRNGDLEEIRSLSIAIREQLGRLLKKYESQTK